jgi:tellurite resistance protein TehA-like permease
LNKKNLNIGYSGLALGITGAFSILKYLGRENGFIELILIGTALFLLVYCAIEFLKNRKHLTTEMMNKVNISLLPTFLMTLANISAHLDMKTLWFLTVGGHLLYGIFFYKKFVFRGSPLVSYYIPLAGIAVNIPHAHLFQMDLLGRFLLLYGSAGYLIVSYRLILYRKNFITITPLLGILCAPLSLCIQGAFIYLDNIFLIKGALVLSLLTTLVVYLIIPAVLMSPFSLGWASLTFPTSAAAIAHLKGGFLLGSSKLIVLGYCEVFLSFMILLMVSAGAFTKKIFRDN